MIFPLNNQTKTYPKDIVGLILLLRHEHLSDIFSRFFIGKKNESIHTEEVSGVINWRKHLEDSFRVYSK